MFGTNISRISLLYINSFLNLTPNLNLFSIIADFKYFLALQGIGKFDYG